MLYSKIILDQLGKELCEVIGRKLTTSNYGRYGTVEQYRDFCIENWDTLQSVHENLIELEDLQQMLETQEFSKWHFFSLIVGCPVEEFRRE